MKNPARGGARNALDEQNFYPHFFFVAATATRSNIVQRMEVKVDDRNFGAPVYVKDGEYLIQEIHCLDDALDFLDDWPLNRRGPIYETAMRACHRAYSRDVPLDVARDAFVGFARSAGIYEKVDSLLPFPMIAQNSGRGGVPT